MAHPHPQHYCANCLPSPRPCRLPISPCSPSCLDCAYSTQGPLQTQLDKRFLPSLLWPVTQGLGQGLRSPASSDAFLRLAGHPLSVYPHAQAPSSLSALAYTDQNVPVHPYPTPQCPITRGAGLCLDSETPRSQVMSVFLTVTSVGPRSWAEGGRQHLLLGFFHWVLKSNYTAKIY